MFRSTTREVERVCGFVNGAVDGNTCAERLTDCGYLVFTPEEAAEVAKALNAVREAVQQLRRAHAILANTLLCGSQAGGEAE